MTSLRIALVLAAAAGCSSSQKEAKAPTTAEAPPVHATPPAAPAPAEHTLGNATGPMQRGMANCPSAVPGARTEMSYSEDGVDLSITAPAHGAQHQIQALGRIHGKMTGPMGIGEHTGKHTGTGRIGYCPIVHTDGTTVRVREIADGVRVHLHADGTDAIAALQSTVYERVLRLPQGQRVVD
jgi:hypothetical protein